jgi:hypothetical protein
MKNFLELLMVGCGADRSSYYKSHASAPTPTLRRDPRISIPYSQSSNGGCGADRLSCDPFLASAPSPTLRRDPRISSAEFRMSSLFPPFLAAIDFLISRGKLLINNFYSLISIMHTDFSFCSTYAYSYYYDNRRPTAGGGV